MEQVGLASVTIDAKEYLLDTMEPVFRKAFTDMSAFLQHELSYYEATGNWIDIVLNVECGNQSASLGIVTEENIDYDWTAWAGAYSLWLTDGNNWDGQLAFLLNLLDTIADCDGDDAPAAGIFDARGYAADEQGREELYRFAETL